MIKDRWLLIARTMRFVEFIANYWYWL